MNETKVPWPRDDEPSGPRRSTPGQGQQCLIYMLGRADEYADSVVPGYGQISAGLGPSPNEDFADTNWPVIVKVKPTVTESDLIQHLRDLADVIEQHPRDPERYVADKAGLNGEQATPAVPDNGIVSMRNQITWSLLNFASLPQSIKAFVDDALKGDDVALLNVAHRALQEYLTTDDISF